MLPTTDNLRRLNLEVEMAKYQAKGGTVWTSIGPPRGGGRRVTGNHKSRHSSRVEAITRKAAQAVRANRRKVHRIMKGAFRVSIAESLKDKPK